MASHVHAHHIAQLYNFALPLPLSHGPPVFDYAAPLTMRSLAAIREALALASSSDLAALTSVPALTGKQLEDGIEGHASVLASLCNVDNQAGILFTVRSSSLRSHGGEISWPGGRVDAVSLIELDNCITLPSLTNPSTE